MIAENSSLLGYVFIVVGVALGLLAYAIYLNIRDGKSKTSTAGIKEVSEGAIQTPLQTEVNAELTEPVSSPPEIEEDDILIEIPKTESLVESIESLSTEPPSSPIPERQDLKTVATLLREVDTGNLLIRVEDAEYTNVDDLMDSVHWSRIDRLTSDMEEWMKSTHSEKSQPKASPSESKLPEKPSAPAKSMVEEINEILERKLKTEDIDRKAIKIIEMLDGSVKVYIGVDSYPIDEVPFEDVRELIRESVSEWEGSR